MIFYVVRQDAHIRKITNDMGDLASKCEQVGIETKNIATRTAQKNKQAIRDRRVARVSFHFYL